MRLPFTLILVVLAYLASTVSKPTKRHYDTHQYYVLEHNPLAGASLAECARELGVEVVEQAGELRDHWLVRAERSLSGLSRREADPVLDTFQALQRQASSRGHHQSRDEELSRQVASAVKYLSPQSLRQRIKRAPPPSVPDDSQTSRTVAERFSISDPEFPRQWHLVNDEFPQHMMNVSMVWEMGFTGQGVITAFVDDGLDYENNDLKANFYAEGSYDFNDHEDLPTPDLFDDHHGTRCAGQVAAVKNDICGVGIAYDSKVAGLRILSGAITDVDEASSLNYDFQNTSIYSCSWGPPDDGKTMEAPGYLIKKAMVNGVQNGRDGKGSIFVFASGNGGRSADQCNFDGYTNSIFSVTVAAVDYKGLHPDYSEACAANMISAYSSGSGNHITTTDKGKDKCSHAHGGTSAAAPNAAGVFALALGARPDLTWRDIQYLCVKTAQKVSPEDPDWDRTATGNLYSYKYGYGALNGYEFVNAALSWDAVNPQTWVNLPVVQLNNGSMDISETPMGGEAIVPGGLTSMLTVTQEMVEDNNFSDMEHITVKVWITHARRGDVEVELVSPNGIKSVLAAKRFADSDNSGYPGWTFMTVKHWGENPLGDWTLRVSDQDNEDSKGIFLGWTMTIWGASSDPSRGMKLYDVPLVDTLLPPPADDSPTVTIPVPSPTSKTLPKPTEHLPGDHGQSEGEASKPAFGGGQASTTALVDDVSATTSPSITATPDEGWFSDLGNLLTNQAWLFVAAGAVVVFAVAVGLFFWGRAARRRTNYTSLPASEDVAMSSISASRATQRTKELYDAFGEVSDDEEDDVHSLQQHDPLSENCHSGFLDDDPSTAAGMTPAPYRDHPPVYDVDKDRSESPGSGSGSGDGSWEHASDTREVR